MKSWIVRVAVGLTVGTMLPAVAMAQSRAPKSIGQPIQVTTNGVTNTVYLDPGGQLRDHDAGRQHRSGDLDRGERAALPQQSAASGMRSPTRRRSRRDSRWP